MAQLKFERYREAGREVIRVVGEIDMATASELEDALAPLASGGVPVSIDLADVTFMDSTGLHALWALATSLDGTGALWIEHPSRIVLRTLEIVGMAENPQIEIRLEDENHG